MRLRQALEHQATHDALSGCLNRAAILDFLSEQLRDLALGLPDEILTFLDDLRSDSDLSETSPSD